MEESMRKRTKASVEENPFNRLPEELVVFIFDKISDAKCLCICRSVSKHFAALVLQTRVLFEKMPGGLKVCSCHADPAAAAGAAWRSRLILSLRNIPYFLFKAIRVMCSLLRCSFRRGEETGLSIPGIMNFLKEFSCTDSITIHFSLGNPDGSNGRPRFEPLLRWKYGLSGFIFASAKNCVALTDENTGNSRVRTANDVAMEEIILSLLLMGQHLLDSFVMDVHIRKIVDILPNLKHAEAVDDMKQGRVVFDEEEIAGIKEKSLLKDKFCVKLWKAPSVKLPLSGCIMEEVSLILIRKIEGCDALEAENSFEEEEYRELVMILVKEEACFQKIALLSNLLAGGKKKTLKLENCLMIDRFGCSIFRMFV